MDTRNRKVFESGGDEPSQNMNRVENTQDEICVPEYFNLPHLLRVSRFEFSRFL